jgi:ornithine cyclodeaminase/alanine dehydrogenase-like protein (mu-crystallin family)
LFKSIEGGLHRLGVYAVRLSSDNILYATRNGLKRREKLPRVKGYGYLGMVLLFNVEDGSLRAIIQDGYINQLLTGATGGLGVKYLSGKNSADVSVLGSGWQARGQLEAVSCVKPIKSVKVFSPTAEHRRLFADEMSRKLEVRVVPTGSAVEAVSTTPVVLVATNAFEPAFFGEWFEPGMTVVSIVGGDLFDQRREVDDTTLTRADLVVVNSKSQAVVDRQGDLFGPIIDRRLLDWDKVIELKDVIGGKFNVGETQGQKIFFKHNTGLGIWYASAALFAVKEAEKRGIGTHLDDELYLEDLRP